MNALVTLVAMVPHAEIFQVDLYVTVQKDGLVPPVKLMTMNAVVALV
jgi:hypothetical protein